MTDDTEIAEITVEFFGGPDDGKKLTIPAGRSSVQVSRIRHRDGDQEDRTENETWDLADRPVNGRTRQVLVRRQPPYDWAVSGE